MKTAQASTESPITPISTPSQCFPPTASASSGLLIATEKLPTRRIFLSPIGWSDFSSSSLAILENELRCELTDPWAERGEWGAETWRRIQTPGGPCILPLVH